MSQTEKSVKSKKRGSVPAKELSVFCSQVAMLLKAGIPLHEGLDSMVDSHTTQGKAIISEIAKSIEQTGSLYESLNTAGVFPHYLVHMTKIGETAGRLEDVMESLSAYYDREDKMRSAVKSAIFYPAILIVLMAAVIAVLVVAVLPVFSEVLAGMGSDAAVSGLSGTIGTIALVVVAVLLVLLMILVIISAFPGGRKWIIRVSSGLPVFKKLYNRMAASRFASVMSIMLTSGFEVDQALELASEVVTDSNVKGKIELCRQRMQSGKSYADALASIGLLSELYARMVQTGEKAGRLDDVMEQLAARYNTEVDLLLNSLISVIEPTMVIILSVVIGSILLSVMLPLINIMSVIG